MRSSSILLVFAILLSTAPTAAQWVLTSGPEGGAIAVLFQDGANVYAGTFLGGIYRSTDGGITWTEARDGFGHQSVVAMTRCGPYLYAAGTEGLYRSSNDGVWWEQTTDFHSYGGAVSLASQGTHMIVGTSDGGVFASSDTGNSWNPSNTGLPNAWGSTWVPVALAAAGSYIVSAGDFTTHSVYRSTNLGATWTAAGTNLPSGEIFTTLHHAGAHLYTAGGDVHRSTNFGGQWEYASSGIPTHAASRGIASGGGVLFAAGTGGVYRSTNAGTAWTAASSGLPFQHVFSVSATGSAALVGMESDGVFRSTDGGGAWSRSAAGLRARQIMGFVTDGTTLYANTHRDVFRTTDDGASWSRVRGNLPDTAAFPALVYASGDTLFLFEPLYPPPFRRSLDGGATWTPIWPEVYGLWVIDRVVRSPSGLWAAAGSIYRSTDNGDTWLSVDSVETASAFFSTMERLNGVLFARGNRVYRSTNDGGDWEDVSPADPLFGQADGMTAVGAELFVMDRFNATLYRSSDGGLTWTTATPPDPGGNLQRIVGHGTSLFATSGFAGLFMSSDLGASWENISGALPPIEPTYDVAVHDGFLYAGTEGNSVWRRPLSEVTGIGRAGPGVPASAMLSQNYPNPFNPSTTIEIRLPAASLATLRIFDLLGRTVATPVDGRLAAGSHTVEWDATGMPSGVYFYRLSAAGSSETRVMLLGR